MEGIINIDRLDLISGRKVGRIIEVFSLKAQGLNSKQIGDVLDCSVRTVEGVICDGVYYFSCKSSYELMYRLTKAELI